LEQIRAFIAVPVSEELRSLVGWAQDGLRAAGADVKWVKPENVHITLKFLGNIASERVGDLVGVMRRAVADVAAFDAVVAGMGTFPGGSRAPRVIWLGLAGGVEPLKLIAGRIDEGCSELGFEREDRPFKSHITIGRVRRGSGGLGELAARAGQLEFNPLQLHVDRVNLVRSRLSPQGPTYTVLESVALERS
jgi:2'-5' RNA ligase